VDNVSFQLKNAEILGLVGESGCGKTTTGRMICALEIPTSGKILFREKHVSEIALSDPKSIHRTIQIVFQNPYESLDPKFTVFESLEEPLRAYGIGSSKIEKAQIVEKMMTRVGIPIELKDLYPAKLSGGQRQRIALARSFLLEPALLIADEPVSMLDASVRASILNILLDMRNSIGTSVILITHDIATARHVCDTICVMYLGEIMEIAPTDEIVRLPLHPYTRALLAAVPSPDPNKPIKIELSGEIGSSTDPPKACRLHPRCPFANEKCRTEKPILREIIPNHYAACHWSEKLFLEKGHDSTSETQTQN
jgi:oligopeptide/dipeptide ABC transporter ATP-binding protein